MQETSHIPVHHHFTEQARPASAPKMRSPKSGKTRGKTILVVTAIVVIAALATLVVLQQLKIHSAGAVEEAARATREEVAKVMILPNEDALVSEIDNADQVKSQPFFSEVQNGDKVLVFPNAARIVIYRPSTKQVVNSGPIVDDTAQPTSAE